MSNFEIHADFVSDILHHFIGFDWLAKTVTPVKNCYLYRRTGEVTNRHEEWLEVKDHLMFIVHHPFKALLTRFCNFFIWY
jgi:hypothetical protein